LQKYLNGLFNAGLKVDGIYSPATEKVKQKAIDILAISNLEEAISQIKSRLITSKFNYSKYPTRWIQWRLKIDVDGIFEAKTESAVKVFQRKCKLLDFGIVEKLTWAKLFK
jgi:peptidoglycan hydrolase-like protein with peptidoglycan-binding domain